MYKYIYALPSTLFGLVFIIFSSLLSFFCLVAVLVNGILVNVFVCVSVYIPRVLIRRGYGVVVACQRLITINR